ncbi:MAG: CRISPR-associated protein Cas4 [Nitrospirae bacterium]|nr:CRISPR-associated protein Cas4 [Nitrospirota bacterium]
MDEATIPISALNQYTYCSRRCALIHVEQTFEENIYTMRGRDLHERTDTPEESGWEDGIRIERALPLWNNRLGLIGKADVVEFHGETPYPVEYKHGRLHKYENDDLQLCAQALCLEEMTGQPVPRGAIFHHSSRSRREVAFDHELHNLVEITIKAIRGMFSSKTIPPPVNDARCRNCSLQEACMPSAIAEQKRTRLLHENLFRVIDP